MAQRQSRKATGWIGFAGVLLLIVGTLNIIQGAAAISNDDLFAVDELLFADLTTWGWIYIVVGALQLLAAALLFKSHASGMIMAVTFASLSGIAHFLSIGAYPLWSVIVMVINFVIIFGLLTNSDVFE